MTKSLDEIIAAVPSAAVRKALQDKHAQFEEAKAEAVVLYELAEADPQLKDEATKKEALKSLGDAILKWQWAIDEIDERLNGADEALRGRSSRAAREG